MPFITPILTATYGGAKSAYASCNDGYFAVHEATPRYFGEYRFGLG